MRPRLFPQPLAHAVPRASKFARVVSASLRRGDVREVLLPLQHQGLERTGRGPLNVVGRSNPAAPSRRRAEVSHGDPYRRLPASAPLSLSTARWLSGHISGLGGDRTTAVGMRGSKDFAAAEW